MAPTVCIIDYPLVESDASSNTRTRHRPCRDGIISKRQRLTLKYFPKNAESMRTPLSTQPTNSTICEAITPSHPMLPEANLPDDNTTQRTLIVNRRKELMDIVVRTLALVRRNYILQVRLDSLRLEAKNFFQSVMNNPDEKNSQTIDDKKVCDNIENLIVSSTIDETDKMDEEQTISLPITNEIPRLKTPLINQVASTCINFSNNKINNLNNFGKLNNC